MAYPTPSIYTYRTVEVNPAAESSGDNAAYYAEFSTNSGSTWLPLFAYPFQSLVEANQAIGKIVSNESRFRTQYLQVRKFNNPAIVPTRTVHSYPPA